MEMGMEMEMEMEMAMRAIEDVEIGEDLTPPLPPLAHTLHDSFLHSHCSACFSPLISDTRRHDQHHLRLSYCSRACSVYDSPVHASSAEVSLLRSLAATCHIEEDTSDLRAALRLLAALSEAPDSCTSGRIAGLLTNRDKLLQYWGDHNSDSNGCGGETLTKIQSGGKVMAAARRAMDNGEVVEEQTSTVLEESALCAVLTNAVEVLDGEGHRVGIAVYGIDFSWVNHSCSPNACYHFQFCSPNLDFVKTTCTLKMRMTGFCDQLQMNADSGQIGGRKGSGEYGPRVIVRSINQIKKGMEVDIAYTDLLQPKEILGASLEPIWLMSFVSTFEVLAGNEVFLWKTEKSFEDLRQLYLQSNYQFKCCCTRCRAQPLTYVDQVLQDTLVLYDSISTCPDDFSFNQDDAIKKLADFMDDVIADYLSDSDAESCCLKLEKLLTLSVLDKELGPQTAPKSQERPFLDPRHYLSMDAYITLASAYKIRASPLDPSPTSKDRMREAFDMLRMSAAYSLLLAGATHHLFSTESSLIVSAANFWANAGESLLNLYRSSQWSESMKLEFPDSTQSFTVQYKSFKCSGKHNEVNCFPSAAACADSGGICTDSFKCGADIAQEVWDFLAHGCPYLQGIKNPINFDWLRSWRISNTLSAPATSNTSNVDSFEFVGKISVYGSQNCNAQKRLLVFQLGIHCLQYGKSLSCICYGQDSFFTIRIKNILQREQDTIISSEQDILDHPNSYSEKWQSACS